MWPYNDEESTWLSAEPSRRTRPWHLEISPDTVADHIQRARALRSRTIRHLAGRLFGRRSPTVRAGLRSGNAAEPKVPVLHDLKTPLTSIRSFSEILRDHPDLPQTQRRRYLEIILSESARLERVIRNHEARMEAGQRKTQGIE